jgi:hypothetical protein
MPEPDEPSQQDRAGAGAARRRQASFSLMRADLPDRSRR